MKVNYHYHSGVSVEVGKDLFIFDYYKQGFDTRALESFENVYVFVSHNHGDHFDEVILSWSKIKSDIQYIFSDDVKIDKKYSNMFFMKAGENLEIGETSILALDSTDEGVAFFVKTQYGNIFHSGDLNWWHWEGESEDYNLGMEQKFKNEINKLSKEKIDVAFIPVDKRLESAMYYSIDYLMNNADVDMVCPIHFLNDTKYLKKVKDDLQNREYYKKINFCEGQI